MTTPPAGMEADYVRVTAGNTGSSLVPADAVTVNVYDGHGNLLNTVSVPLNAQGVGPGNTVTAVQGLPGGFTYSTCQTDGTS